MTQKQCRFLSNLHDTLFLGYEEYTLRELLDDLKEPFDPNCDKEVLVDAIVDYVSVNFKSVTKGNQAYIGKSIVNVNHCHDLRLTDAIMNLDMKLNHENPASITDFYRIQPIELRTLIKEPGVTLSSGQGLMIVNGNVCIDRKPIKDIPESYALQIAAVEWLAESHPKVDAEPALEGLGT